MAASVFTARHARLGTSRPVRDGSACWCARDNPGVLPDDGTLGPLALAESDRAICQITMPYEIPPDLAGMSLSKLPRPLRRASCRRSIAGSRSEPATARCASPPTVPGTTMAARSPVPRWCAPLPRCCGATADGQHWLVTPITGSRSRSRMPPSWRSICAPKAMRWPSGSTPTNWSSPGPTIRLRAEGDPDAPAIYLAVRHGCEARLNRSTWLQLAEYALAEGDDLDRDQPGRGVRAGAEG